jgi:hypothetical protein
MLGFSFAPLGMGMQSERFPRTKKRMLEISEMIFAASLALLFFGRDKIIWDNREVYPHEGSL